MKKIIAFAGSNSSTSINQQVVKYAATLFTNTEVEVIDLREYDAPIYSADIEKAGIPQAIQDFVQKLAEADAYIMASPEHNGSLSAFFKNILDWASRVEGKFVGGKPVLLLSTSGGKRGGASALEDLRIKMKYFAGEVLGSYSLGAFYENFDQQTGTISNDSEKKALSQVVSAFEKSLISN
ncbi:MAG: NAD(P)H-dependent oxidoreductase [Reichenbachiella sp.]|uniref:NADPH-dependent FMN reductase n=1 Tax=Reichenbachiella sp. TaxID=2184521 RepID=UPI003267203F